MSMFCFYYKKDFIAYGICFVVAYLINGGKSEVFGDKRTPVIRMADLETGWYKQQVRFRSCDWHAEDLGPIPIPQPSASIQGEHSSSGCSKTLTICW